MKRILTCLVAPLLVMMLMSFTSLSVQTEQRIRGKDSTMVNVIFSPAQIIVKDNRTIEAITSIIKANSESNIQVATAVEKIAEVSSKNLSLQERRCASVMDRITQQTGLSVVEVNKIIHKKRVYDMTFYTLFILYTLYFYLSLAKMTYYNIVISVKEWGIKVLSGLLTLLLLMFIYVILGEIINGPSSSIIQTVINSPPG